MNQQFELILKVCIVVLVLINIEMFAFLFFLASICKSVCETTKFLNQMKSRQEDGVDNLIAKKDLKRQKRKLKRKNLENNLGSDSTFEEFKMDFPLLIEKANCDCNEIDKVLKTESLVNIENKNKVILTEEIDYIKDRVDRINASDVEPGEKNGLKYIENKKKRDIENFYCLKMQADEFYLTGGTISCLNSELNNYNIYEGTNIAHGCLDGWLYRTFYIDCAEYNYRRMTIIFDEKGNIRNKFKRMVPKKEKVYYDVTSYGLVQKYIEDAIRVAIGK